MTNFLGPWKEDYELGVEDIDLQHHFFFNLVNRIASELLKTKNTQYRMDLINELNAYAKFHFTSEENIMRKVDYPGLSYHKNLHFDLIQLLSTKGNQLLLTEDNSDANDVVQFLGEWFLHHTREVDRKLVNYLTELEE